MRHLRSALTIAITLAAIAFSTSVASAADAVAAAAKTTEPPAAGLAIFDWVIIVFYGLSTLALGWYYGRKQENTTEYFVGSGNMNPMLIGVSLFATLLSTISYLSMPGEMLGKGPISLLSIVALPLVFLIVAFLILPFYMKQRVTSAYELLEDRLGVEIRLLGAGMFVVLRLVWMSLLVYLTAEALALMIGVGPGWIPTIALITGMVAVVYTSLGGLRAVVITDLMQTILLFGGALLVLAIVTIDLGGFSWFPRKWQANWDTQPLLPIDPETGRFDIGMRVTVVGSIINVLIWYVATSAGDQTSVQRFMATTDARAARRALATQLSVSVVVTITLGLVGLALLGYFSQHPELLPPGKNLKDHADEIFPLFIAYQLPIGISGLVVSAMFAAAMSSIDSGVNSITAVVMTDFLDRFDRTPRTEKGHMLAAKGLAFAIGAIVVVGSSLMEYVPGNISEVTTKTANLLTTPIFCLFFFALFVPFARPIGVFAGAVCGTLTAAVIAFSGPLVVWLSHRGVDPATFNTTISRTVDAATGIVKETAVDPVSFQWIGLTSVVVNVGVGCAISYVLPRRKRDAKA